jgi:hypothetical protein
VEDRGEEKKGEGMGKIGEEKRREGTERIGEAEDKAFRLAERRIFSSSYLVIFIIIIALRCTACVLIFDSL